MHPLYSQEFSSAVELAIESAELKTSCEFKIHLEDDCNEDVFDRAAYVFSELELHKTQQRNAILIFIVIQSRKVVILADVGVSNSLSTAYIEEQIALLTSAFKSENFISGISEVLDRMGNFLSASFPRTENDVNEISNTLSR